MLFFLHTVKKIPEPLFGDWGGGLVSGIGYYPKHIKPSRCHRKERQNQKFRMAENLVVIQPHVAPASDHNSIAVWKDAGRRMPFYQYPGENCKEMFPDRSKKQYGQGGKVYRRLYEFKCMLSDIRSQL